MVSAEVPGKGPGDKPMASPGWRGRPRDMAFAGPHVLRNGLEG